MDAPICRVCGVRHWGGAHVFPRTAEPRSTPTRSEPSPTVEGETEVGSADTVEDGPRRRRTKAEVREAVIDAMRAKRLHRITAKHDRRTSRPADAAPTTPLAIAHDVADADPAPTIAANGPAGTDNAAVDAIDAPAMPIASTQGPAPTPPPLTACTDDRDIPSPIYKKIGEDLLGVGVGPDLAVSGRSSVVDLGLSGLSVDGGKSGKIVGEVSIEVIQAPRKKMRSGKTKKNSGKIKSKGGVGIKRAATGRDGGVVEKTASTGGGVVGGDRKAYLRAYMRDYRRKRKAGTGSV